MSAEGRRVDATVGRGDAPVSRFLRTTQPDLWDAPSLRDRGMEQADSAEGSAWKADADRAIRHLASFGGTFSAEDVRRLAGPPVHANAMGQRFQTAMRDGVIRCVGFGVGHRPASRGRAIRLYVGTAL